MLKKMLERVKSFFKKAVEKIKALFVKTTVEIAPSLAVVGIGLSACLLVGSFIMMLGVGSAIITNTMTLTAIGLKGFLGIFLTGILGIITFVISDVYQRKNKNTCDINPIS